MSAPGYFPIKDMQTTPPLSFDPVFIDNRERAVVWEK